MELLVVLAVLLLCAALGIKYRIKIAKWLNDPNSDYPYREKILKRRIEDASEELNKMAQDKQEEE